MPLIEVVNIKNVSTATIYVWELAESLSFFEEKTVLNYYETIIYNEFKLENRKKQWLAIRLLLQEVLGENYSAIFYGEFGQPLLKKGHISISHSKNFISIALSENKCGVDIEEFSEKIERISHKFISEDELPILQNQNSAIDNLHLAWCAKESVFKWFANGGLDFKTDMVIKQIDDSSMIIDFTKTNQELKLDYQLKKNKGYYLVYVVE